VVEKDDVEALKRATQDKQAGKAPSTQAGEFVREEIHHVREGKHGARSSQQAIAIGLSKARRAGIHLVSPSDPELRKKAESDLRKGRQSEKSEPSAKRSRGVTKALKREGRTAASHKSLSQQTRRAARERGPKARRQAAQKAVKTKGKAGMKHAARKAARTRAKNRTAA